MPNLVGVWALYFKLLPRWLEYTLREKVVRLQNGELSKHFVRDYSQGHIQNEREDSLEQVRDGDERKVNAEQEPQLYRI